MIFKLPWEREKEFAREREISSVDMDGLRKRIRVLEAAIRKHRDERGHARCWLDDQELYSVLPESINQADFKLPPKEEFLRECERYHSSRQPTDSKDGPGS